MRKYGEFDMKYKVIFCLSSVLLLLLVSSALADPNGGVRIEAWTDKASYQPGAKGTLYITIRNEEDSAVTIYNITVEFPWYSRIKGGGNITKIIDEALKADEVYDTEVEFSVPNDGRATDGVAQIDVMTDALLWPYSGGAYIPVASPGTLPATNNLIIILIVIVLVCIGGIMAMIYWAMKSMTRPQIARPS